MTDEEFEDVGQELISAWITHPDYYDNGMFSDYIGELDRRCTQFERTRLVEQATIRIDEILASIMEQRATAGTEPKYSHLELIGMQAHALTQALMCVRLAAYSKRTIKETSDG